MSPRSRKPTAPAHAPTLFNAAARRDPSNQARAPLAERVRPATLAAMLGQEHLLGDGKLLARAIATDRVPSMILWGPPGSGKTTLARVIAERTRAHFVPFNAVLGGVAELREILAAAKTSRDYEGRRTLLFVDEIHRFNKGQQDAFLPHVEDGTVTLIGATTENPSFSVNAPLLSRCKVFRLRGHDVPSLTAMLERAVLASEGLAGSVDVDPSALEAIATLAQGDARRALTTLEMVAEEAQSRGDRRIAPEHVASASEEKPLLYDKAGEEHYNVTSALIKSLRGSDPDAAIYWLMRMVEAGDDPLFLLRRLLVFASEDVGNADPRALELTVAADAAFRRMGLPEGLYPLAQACLYLATAPKSNSVGRAFQAAREAVHAQGSLPVPLKLRNAVTRLMRDEGYASGYRYAHDEVGAVARGERYLPEELESARFYEPSERGYEKTIGERLRWIRGEPPLTAPDGDGKKPDR